MTCASLACARPPQGGPFHVWPWGSLDTPPKGLSHATPLGGCCVTVHDPSPAHAGGSCLPCQGGFPHREASVAAALVAAAADVLPCLASPPASPGSTSSVWAGDASAAVVTTAGAAATPVPMSMSSSTTPAGPTPPAWGEDALVVLAFAAAAAVPLMSMLLPPAPPGMLSAAREGEALAALAAAAAAAVAAAALTVPPSESLLPARACPSSFACGKESWVPACFVAAVRFNVVSAPFPFPLAALGLLLTTRPAEACPATVTAASSSAVIRATVRWPCPSELVDLALSALSSSPCPRTLSHAVMMSYPVGKVDIKSVQTDDFFVDFVRTHMRLRVSSQPRMSALQ